METIRIENNEAVKNFKKKKIIMPSTTGRLIKSSFYIAVSSGLDACCVCCSAIPVVHNPVVIFP